MATYVIGDVQGCYAELCRLLEMIGPTADDRIWFVGDLVNRGPESRAVLALVEGLGEQAVAVLGNHDVYLLSLAAGLREPKAEDTCQDILQARDGGRLIDWLRHRPLLHDDADSSVIMVHAGLAAQWDRCQALQCAREVEAVLQSAGYRDFLSAMYGNQPSLWRDDLSGVDRWRCTLNALTRQRLCDRHGRMFLNEKGPPVGRSDGLLPWFDVPGRATRNEHVVFGHWSTLGRYQAAGIDAIDCGCLWGGALLALRLEDGQEFNLPCRGYRQPG